MTSTSQDRTLWARSIGGQLASFLRTESGSSGVLVLAIAAALVWSNASAESFRAVWTTPLSIQLGSLGIDLSLREWVSSGLMTLFFLVVGLEARREFDLGALRDRKQFIVPFTAGIVGMAIPVGIFLLFNSGGTGAHGWGVAMSTDTALALGLLSLLGRNVPERVRGFLVTLFIVDDVVALLVIAFVYSSNIQWMPLVVSVIAFALIPVMKRIRRTPSVFFGIAGIVSWGALLFSGVDPVVAGLAIGLASPAYTPGRDSLEQAAGVFRQFREQPSSQLARVAGASLVGATSPNERLQSIYHPWTSYVIVPLFALANAGIHIDGAFLATALTSPITIGVFVGYVVGKPVAVLGTSWLISRLSGRRLTPPVGWGAVAGSGTIAGVGFTVAVLVATLAFTGRALDEAKIGVLAAALVASVATWLVYRVIALLPLVTRSRALLGDGLELEDLISAPDPERDHIRGPADASVTVVEYGDFQCPYCGRAEPSVRELLTDVDVRFVWRHLPLGDVHPQAHVAAEAAEAAAAQGEFWRMHDLLLSRQEHLYADDLVGYADELGLDVALFTSQLEARIFRPRIAEDVRSADLSGASGTPTFFINGQRHYGSFDVASLRDAVRTARDQAKINA
jgi:Na+/H+ antiporter NhaA